MRAGLILICLSVFGCATKTVCPSGGEPFRPVFDSANSCKVRIRQVVIGSDIKMPKSISFNGGTLNWNYEWKESEFKRGQIELGHLVLRPVTSETP